MNSTFRPNRRHALCCTGALAAGLFSGLLTGCNAEGGDGNEAPSAGAGDPANLVNPCRDGLARLVATDGAVRELLERSFAGLDATRLVDGHAHLLGTGDSGSGCTVHPSMHQWWRPLEVLRRRAILNAACVPSDAASIDRRYVQRLAELAGAFPAGARWWLYAFAKAHDDDGRPRDDWSTFHVPDAYAARIAGAQPDRFDWVASIHPYAPDALERLAWLALTAQ